jgi:uncharacterized membrane protein YkvA (DUF1232 family)
VPAVSGTHESCFPVTINAESKFVDLVRGWLVTLPHDLKVAFDAMDDENLPREARELAVGAIIYVVSPNDIIGDRNDAIVSFTDDALLLRLALLEVVAKSAEDGTAFRDKYPEVFDGIEDDLKLCSGVLGDLMTWLTGKLPTLRTQIYKGSKLPKYLDDDESREQLFEDGLVFRTEYPVDERTVGDKLKKATTITDVMRRARAEEARLGA